MKAGKLRHRITIQRQLRQPLPSGQQSGDWVDVATVWADAKCTRSTIADADGVMQDEMVYKFYIRWRPDIRAAMRVLWQGRTFELTGPPADWEEERSGLTLLTRELVEYAETETVQGE